MSSIAPTRFRGTTQGLVSGNMSDTAGSQARLRAPRHAREPAGRATRATRALAGWVVIAAVQVVWLLSGDGGAIHTILLVATTALASTHVAVMPQWRYRVHRWEAAATAVYTQTGAGSTTPIAPVSRIQTVDTERGPLEQVFGLANVTVTTASAAGPLKIRGLDSDTADRLVDELTAARRRRPATRRGAPPRRRSRPRRRGSA